MKKFKESDLTNYQFPEEEWKGLIDFYNAYARIPYGDSESNTDCSATLLYGIREFMGEYCKTYLEIGTLFGFSMTVAMRASSPCKFIGIDLFENPENIDPCPQFPGINVFAEDIAYRGMSQSKALSMIQNQNKHGHEISLIMGDSHSEETVKKATSISDSIDLFYIDGDHTYDGAKKDFNAFFPFVSSGGVIFFDDQDYEGINKLVKELDKREDLVTIPVSGFGEKILMLFQKV